MHFTKPVALDRSMTRKAPSLTLRRVSDGSLVCGDHAQHLITATAVAFIVSGPKLSTLQTLPHLVFMITLLLNPFYRWGN